MAEPKDKAELKDTTELKDMTEFKDRNHTAINSKQLDRARRWYYVQSRILRIPDRWGLISTGPPPRQVFEVQEVSRLTEMFCLSQACLAVGLYETFKEGGDTHWPYMWMSLSSELMFLLALSLSLFRVGPRNDPNLNWGTWEMGDEPKRIGWLTEVMNYLSHL